MAALTYPAIDPVAFRVGTIAVHWYGIAYLVGFVAAWQLLRWLDRRWGLGLSEDACLEVLLAAVIGVVVGARVGYVLVYSKGVWLSDPLYLFRTWEGGMSFHGGLAGILVAAAIESRRLGLGFLRLCDAGAVGAPVGLLLGRLANFVNGELWGRPSDVAWAMVFPAAGPMPRHPSQLYEAFAEGLVLLVVMLVLARRKRGDGLMLGTMIGLYGILRIALETFREPDAQIGFLAGGATMGQLLSVPMVVAGAWLVWRALRAERAART